MQQKNKSKQHNFVYEIAKYLRKEINKYFPDIISQNLPEIIEIIDSIVTICSSL